MDKLLSFHAGPVVSVDTSPISHKMATLGVDGTIRFYDYSTKALLNRMSYPQGGSFLTYMPLVNGFNIAYGRIG